MKNETWKPYSWIGEYLGYQRLAECIIVTKRTKKRKKNEIHKSKKVSGG